MFKEGKAYLVELLAAMPKDKTPEELADWLIERGVLASELKIDQAIWTAEPFKYHEIHQGYITSLCISFDGVEDFYTSFTGIPLSAGFSICDIGSTVFLTEEEAHASMEPIKLHQEYLAKLNSSKHLSFINDEEKMNDFHNLSKEQFLESYSYLSEEEYDSTFIDYNNMLLVQALSTMGFRLDYNDHGIYLWDEQLGIPVVDTDYVQMYFTSAKEIFARLETYINDIFIADFEDEFEQYNLAGKIPTTIRDWVVFGNSCKNGTENTQKFYNEHARNFEILNLITNTYEYTDLYRILKETSNG